MFSFNKNKDKDKDKVALEWRLFNISTNESGITFSYFDIPQICQNEKDGDILAAKKEMKLADEEDFGNRFVSLEDLFYLSEKNM